MKTFSIAIHGGAGPRVQGISSAEKEQEYIEALRAALDGGSHILEQKGSALDAVEQAVISLEDCTLFNAGKGSVYSADGTHELDASIMDGNTLEAGAVAQLRGIQNPVRLAREVMDKSEHVFLAATGAMQFADQLGYERMDDEYFADTARYQQWLDVKEGITSPASQKLGTVGAVALDTSGTLAAATSTGGVVNKRFGRIGDSPIIGAGTYANNRTCAVSCTGSGEFFIRGVAAYDLSCLIEYRKMPLQAAADEVIHQRLPEINGDGGLIAVDSQGNIAMPFNTQAMFRACAATGRPAEVYI